MEEKTQQHRAEQMFDVNSKWCVPCECGEKFTSPTPTGAVAKHKKHADSATKADKRAATSGATPARAKHCGCGCGEPLAARAGGLFRSGHDARFKSVLTVAHAQDTPVPHPLTGEPSPAMDIADWLDERRGVGTFWRDKVAAGHKPQPERAPRPPKGEVTEADKIARSHARVDAIMEFNATRRPVPGDMGTVTLRSGKSHGARVIRRENEDALAIRFTDGPQAGVDAVIPDHRFAKARKSTDVRI